MRTRFDGKLELRGTTPGRVIATASALTAMIGLMAALPLTSWAQDQPPPPPPGDFGPGGPGGFGGGPGGPGGHGGPGGPGGMRRPGPPRPASLSDAPVEILASALNLSGDQQDKLREMQRSFRDAERSERQSAGFQPPRPGGPGEMPSEEQMRAFDEKRKAFDAKTQSKSRAADQEMAKILTDAQKRVLPAVLKSMDALQMAGIPAPLQAELKISADQRTKLAVVADKYGPKPGDTPQPGQQFDPRRNGGRREQARAAVMAVFTDAQKAALSDWEAAHPRPSGRP